MTACEGREGSVSSIEGVKKFQHLVAAGVIDPTEVSRTALQNAASIAGLLLTTEAVVAEKPEENGGGGHGGPGGGMPGGRGDSY